MNISVPSRFACLKLEDEEQPKINKPSIEKKKIDKTQKPQKEVKKPIKQGNKKEKKVKQQMQKQWEEWKKKDDQLVNGHFEQDLENAILLSKLHYEENKDKYDNKLEEATKKSDKKKKNKPMSLNEFLAEDTVKEVEIQVKNQEPKENFFDTIHLDAKKEINKENLLEQRKKRESSIEQIISSAQYHEKLEIERKKNKDLEEKLEKAHEEITYVKERNQTLCSMLSTGEMKDKADVLYELDKLNGIKNDLTEEVARLHALLEQERSKVASLMAENKHKKSKKHV